MVLAIQADHHLGWFPRSIDERHSLKLSQIFSPDLVDALQAHAANEVYGLQANIGIPSSQFDIRAYFGGKNRPEYLLAYKIYIKDSESMTAVRKVQKEFMGELSNWVHTSNTFIAFGKEGLVLDVGSDIKFDLNR
ncbi:hypothetical protein BU25DRAFT_421084 [Macroventuria anomochaeta]|uniref:Uncharacterized protein n=1 Tax=Macroventuria anomochaeta TaxID=301207 RepID=A0ACB6S1P7_9PLEO|nr:uncharacterized protein BU25DRAFT_421084 [Macroventuria anomochaeta]KAF2628066.1 hypothetical protein BU25DRAFT_421084 [Macroventuria anomochaeta]